MDWSCACSARTPVVRSLIVFVCCSVVVVVASHAADAVVVVKIVAIPLLDLNLKNRIKYEDLYSPCSYCINLKREKKYDVIINPDHHCSPPSYLISLEKA